LRMWISRSAYSPRFPAGEGQCDWAFVSAYRCGAVPDLHRIPEPAPDMIGSGDRRGTTYRGGRDRSTQ